MDIIDLDRLEALAGVRLDPKERTGLARDLKNVIAFAGRLPAPATAAATDGDILPEDVTPEDVAPEDAAPEDAASGDVAPSGTGPGVDFDRDLAVAGFPQWRPPFVVIPAPVRPAPADEP